MTRKSMCAVALSLLCLILSVNGYGQSVNAAVGGTVADPSKALIPRRHRNSDQHGNGCRSHDSDE